MGVVASTKRPDAPPRRLISGVVREQGSLHQHGACLMWRCALTFHLAPSACDFFRSATRHASRRTGASPWYAVCLHTVTSTAVNPMLLRARIASKLLALIGVLLAAMLLVGGYGMRALDAQEVA